MKMFTTFLQNVSTTTTTTTITTGLDKNRNFNLKHFSTVSILNRIHEEETATHSVLYVLTIKVHRNHVENTKYIKMYSCDL